MQFRAAPARLRQVRIRRLFAVQMQAVVSRPPRRPIDASIQGRGPVRDPIPRDIRTAFVLEKQT